MRGRRVARWRSLSTRDYGVIRKPTRSFASPAGVAAWTSTKYSPTARPASDRSIGVLPFVARRRHRQIAHGLTRSAQEPGGHGRRRPGRRVRGKANQQPLRPAELARGDRHGVVGRERAELARVSRAQHFQRADRHVPLQLADRDVAHVDVEDFRRHVLNRHVQSQPAGRHVEDGARGCRAGFLDRRRPGGERPVRRTAPCRQPSAR